MKPNLLLLHGALGTLAQFDQLVPLLQDTFTLHSFEFEGHGQTPLQDRPLLSSNMVASIVDFLAQHKIEQTNIFGYSLGGYIGCKIAHSHPELVNRIVTLGTRYRWDETTAAREAKFLNVDKIEEKVPRFAQMLAEQHPAAGWKPLVHATVDMLYANAKEGGLPPAGMAQLSVPLRIIVGDRDATAELSESHAVYEAMLAAKCAVEFEVLPNTPHPFDRADAEQVAGSIKGFMGAGG